MHIDQSKPGVFGVSQNFFQLVLDTLLPCCSGDSWITFFLSVATCEENQREILESNGSGLMEKFSFGPD